MKALFSFVVLCTTMLSVYAQGSFNTVTINYPGQHRQVLVDGKSFTAVENTNDAAGTRGNIFSIVTNALAPGTHRLSLVRQNNRRSSETSFTLRANYDLTINIDGNGSFQQTEKFRRLGTDNAGEAAMTTTRFNALVAQISRNRQATARYNMIQSAFANTTYHFSTAQARRLIQLINGEPFRLQLAKNAVRSITDTRNIYGLTSVLNSQASRNELSEFIKANVTATGTQTGGTEGTGNATTAMTTATFNALLEDVKNKWQSGARYTAIQSAFATSSNYYFSTGQAAQLVQLLSSESERLQMLKDSYKKIVDPSNFTQIYTLLNSQASRDELSYHVRMMGTPGTQTSNGNATTAMTTATFNALMEDVRNRWQSGARYTAIQSAFATSSNYYFSTAQAAQLIQLLSSEGERLEMLKDSYKKIVDPANFPQTYTLLSSQASRDDLSYYVRMNGTPGTAGNTGSNPGSPMSDASYNSIYESIRSAWGTGVRKREVLNVFANTGNYFSTYQAAQLVQLESGEQDRLDLAKASLRSITDRQNITLLYNALATQAARNELAAYINTYGFTGNNTGTQTTNMTPMSDANFNALLEDTRRLWIPGAKKATVLQVFATANNYFTTAQAIQLIQLDNDEPDRLAMAKASYKTLVDKQNFARVYDLFTTQGYKDELAAYISSIQ